MVAGANHSSCNAVPLFNRLDRWPEGAESGPFPGRCPGLNNWLALWAEVLSRAYHQPVLGARNAAQIKFHSVRAICKG